MDMELFINRSPTIEGGIKMPNLYFYFLSLGIAQIHQWFAVATTGKQYRCVSKPAVSVSSRDLKDFQGLR